MENWIAAHPTAAPVVGASLALVVLLIVLYSTWRVVRGVYGAILRRRGNALRVTPPTAPDALLAAVDAVGAKLEAKIEERLRHVPKTRTGWIKIAKGEAPDAPYKPTQEDEEIAEEMRREWEGKKARWEDWCARRNIVYKPTADAPTDESLLSAAPQSVAEEGATKEVPPSGGSST